MTDRLCPGVAAVQRTVYVAHGKTFLTLRGANRHAAYKALCDCNHESDNVAHDDGDGYFPPNETDDCRIHHNDQVLAVADQWVKENRR